MSGKNLPGGLIPIKDNADGTLSYVFDKFCIFEKGYMNGPYSPLNPIIQPTTGSSIPVFNYGLSNGVLFYFTDGKGNTITVQQNPETGSYTLTFPSINTNDTLVTTNLAQTLTNKTLTTPILNPGTNVIQIGTAPDYINIETDIKLGSGLTNLVLPDTGTTILKDTSLNTLYNKTLYSPIFSGTSSGIIQNASQYCFEAYVSSARNAITGTGNVYTVIFDQIPYQIGSGYDASTGIFTAPVAGLYKFNTSVVIFGLTTSNTTVGLSFAVNTTGNAYIFLGNQIGDVIGYMVVSGSRIFNMTAGDTISVSVMANGSTTNNVAVSGGQYGIWLQMHLLTSYV